MFTVGGCKKKRPEFNKGRTYRSTDGVFAFDLPQDWEVLEKYCYNEAMQQNELVDLIGPVGDDVVITITVRSRESIGVSLDTYFSDYIASGGAGYIMWPNRYKRRIYYDFQYPPTDTVLRKKVLIDGKDGRELVFKDDVVLLLPKEATDPFALSMGKTVRWKARVRQVLTIHKNQVYIISLNACEEGFERDNAVLQKVLNTWRWGAPIK